MPLTEKQQVFARALAHGKTQAEAYRLAYDTSNSAENTIAANACKEANKPEIKSYVEKLKRDIDNYSAIEKSKDESYIRTLLIERIEICRKKGDENAIARYSDMLAKMNGLYINITKDITDEQKPVERLTTDELKALLQADQPPQEKKRA